MARRQSDHVIVNSSAMRDEVREYLQLDPNDLTIVPNAVDAERWASTPAERREVRDRLGIAHDAPLLALPARIKAHKGGGTAADALRLIHLHHSEAHLVFAGAGDYEDALKALAASHGLSDHVHFTGQLGDRDLAALMGAADMVLAPSWYEPFGLAPLAAGAAGTPVIAAAVGGAQQRSREHLDAVVSSLTAQFGRMTAELESAGLDDGAVAGRFGSHGAAVVDGVANARDAIDGVLARAGERLDLITPARGG